MPKTKRLIELIMTVNAKRTFTVRELADEFEVSTRTIMRDLQELSELGVPLYSEVGPHGGYRILQERVLPPISFTESEAVALFFACQSLQHYRSLPFEAESQAALKKFYHYLPADTQFKIQQMKDRVLFWIPTRNQISPFLQEIVEAAIHQDILTVEYDSKNGTSKRDLQPIGLYSNNGYWYCPAYCCKREEIRLSRADRMRSVKKNENGSPRKEISSLTINDLIQPPSKSPDQVVPLKVQLTRKGVRIAQSEMWLEPQIKVHGDGSGWIDTTLDKREISYFSEYFFGLGVEAKVEEPREMVDAIKENIARMLDHYS